LALQRRRRGHDVEFYAAGSSEGNGEALKEGQVAVHTRPELGVVSSVNPVANVLLEVFENPWERCRESRIPACHENLG
jgi:hypothetical protein